MTTCHSFGNQITITRTRPPYINKEQQRMRSNNTDEAWELFGKLDPYFGVIADPKFHISNLSEFAREDFFDSGSTYVSKLAETIRGRVKSNFHPQRSLDFGCGVGRILLPLANLSTEVVGIDVSKAMLTEASINIKKSNKNNVKLLLSDDNLSSLDGSFDFIHSYIVFQHIDPTRGEKMLNQLLHLLSPEGVAALHFTYGSLGARLKIVSFMQRRVPFARNMFNILRGRKWSYPCMEMHSYSLPRLIDIFSSNGVNCFYAEATNHGNYVGLQFFLYKDGQSAHPNSSK